MPRRRRWTRVSPAAASAAASGAARRRRGHDAQPLLALVGPTSSHARDGRARRGRSPSGAPSIATSSWTAWSEPRGELLERPGGDEAAGGEEPDPVAQRLDLAQDVRREQDGQVALVDEAPEQREQLLDARRVDRDRRLVEDQDRRLLDQGVGDAQPLAHAAGVGVGALVGRVARGGPRGAARRSAPRPRERGDAVELRRVAQVLATGQAAVEADVVGQVAHLALDAPAARGSGPGPTTRTTPLVGLGEAEQHQDRGGLAGAVRAQEPEHLARGGSSRSSRSTADELAVLLGQPPRRR